MNGAKSIGKLFSVVLVLWLGLGAWPLLGAAQTDNKGLTKDGTIALLKGEVPTERVAELARQRSIDFEITPENESDLRKAGATDDLINTLRGLAPKPATIPVLEIYSDPGSAQVYVDDLLVARTSAEGHVRIATLTPGEHRLRFSAEGHDDYEKSFTFAAGKTLIVTAMLPVHAATALEVRSSPGHAQVYIDNVAHGQTSEGGELRIPNVAAGSHRIRITLDGYREDERQVELAAGRTAQVTVTLAKAELPANPLPPTPAGPSFMQWRAMFRKGVSFATGTLTIANGTLSFQSDSKKQSFSFPVTDIDRAFEKMGDMWTRHDLHIILKSGKDYCFISSDKAGHKMEGARFVTQVLDLINQAKGQK